MLLKDRKYVKNTRSFPKYYGGLDNLQPISGVSVYNTNNQQNPQIGNIKNIDFSKYYQNGQGGNNQQGSQNPTGAIGSAGLGPWGSIAEIAATNVKGFINELNYLPTKADQIESNQGSRYQSYGGILYKQIDNDIDVNSYRLHWSTQNKLNNFFSGNIGGVLGIDFGGGDQKQLDEIKKAINNINVKNRAARADAFSQYWQNRNLFESAYDGRDANTPTRSTGNKKLVNTAYGKQYLPQNAWANKGEQIVDTLTYDSYKVKSGRNDTAPTFLRGRDAVLTASRKPELLNPETGNTFAEDWPAYKAAGMPQRLLDLQSYVHIGNNMNNKNRRNGYITAKTGEDAIPFYDDLLVDLPNINVSGKKPSKIGELLRAAQYTPNITNNIGDIDYSYLFDNLKNILGVPVGANLAGIGRIPTSIVDTGSPRMFPDKHNNSIGAISYYPRMNSPEQPDTDNLAYKPTPLSRFITTPPFYFYGSSNRVPAIDSKPDKLGATINPLPSSLEISPFYFYGNSNRTSVKNSPDKKPSSLTPDNVSSIVPPIDFGLEPYNITNPQQRSPENNKPGLNKDLKRIDKGRIPEIKPWEILLSRLPGFASSIIGAINTKKQPTSKINSYAPNTYAKAALPKLAGLRANATPILKDIDDKYNAYVLQLNSQSSLTAGLKQLYQMAAMRNAQMAKANAMMNVLNQNNKYISDWANAAINVGDKDASNRIATTQYDKQYMDRALAARNKIYNSFLTDIYNQTGATTRDLMNSRMLNAMLNRYQA